MCVCVCAFVFLFLWFTSSWFCLCSCESGSYLISRALGPKLGGAVGLLYYLGVVLLAVLEVKAERGSLSSFPVCRCAGHFWLKDLVNLVGSSGKRRSLISTLLNIFILQQFLLVLDHYQESSSCWKSPVPVYIRKFCECSPENYLTVSWGGCHDDHCSGLAGFSADLFYCVFCIFWILLTLMQVSCWCCIDRHSVPWKWLCSLSQRLISLHPTESLQQSFWFSSAYWYIFSHIPASKLAALVT